ALDELDSIQGNLTLTAPGGNGTNNNIDNTAAGTRGALTSGDSDDDSGEVDIIDTPATTGTSIISDSSTPNP
ncbi:MAG: hypothetical protein M3299_09335, partial [Thermoproteota archaeon]|nr:hypothetical protein [Thermoproteota archaeon]